MKKYVCMLFVFTFLITSCKPIADKSKINQKQVTITISAASSLKNVMEKIKISYYKKQNDIKILINYGGSGSLKQQIEQGAPVDLFISADEKQMNELDAKSLLLDNTRKNLLNNTMVLITSKANTNIKEINSLTNKDVKKIAIGDITTVPAGDYANQILNYYDLKSKISDKLIFGSDVTQVLSWIESGNADCGFVYKTDVLLTNLVQIAIEFPEKSHDEIVYPMSIISSSKHKDEAKNFQEFLISKEVIEIFREYGFIVNNYG